MGLLKLVLFYLLATSSATAQENLGIQTLSFHDEERNRLVEVEIVYLAETSPVAKSNKSNGSGAAETGFLENIPVWEIGPITSNATPSRTPTKRPLLLFSHGDGGSKEDSRWFLAKMAASGYIAVSVNHYGNTWNRNKPEVALRRWERPRDISFVIDQLLKSREWSSLIHSNQIGFAGFSLGGLTGVWLIGGVAHHYRKPGLQTSHYTELADGITSSVLDKIDFSPARFSYYEPRIRAAFLMAPAYGFAFDEKNLQTIKTPTFIVAGESDTVVPILSNAAFFAKNIPHCSLKILPGKVGHFVFLNSPSEQGKKVLPKAIIEDEPTVDRRQIHEEVGKMATEFFTKHLPLLVPQSLDLKSAH